MQAVAVVVNRDQRLQRGADVVELDFLRVQATPAGLDVVLELLAALVGTVFFLHGHGPDAPGYATHHGVFGVHAVAKEKAQVGREVVNMHAPRQIGLDKGKTIGQRESQLADRVGPGLGNVVAADGHAVEIAHLVVHKILGHIAHHLERELGRKNTGVLPLVFLQDVRLYRAAHVLQHPGTDVGRLVGTGFAAVFGAEFLQVLVDCRVHEHRQDAGRRAVDRHGHAGAGAAQIKSTIQHLEVVDGGNAHAGVAHLAVNVRAPVRVVAIQGHRVKGGGQALGGHALAEQLKAGVGAKGVALTGKHARGVLALALEGKSSGGVGVMARHVVQHQPLQDVARVLVFGQGHFGNHRAAERGRGQGGAHFFVADFDDQLGAGIVFLHLWPVAEQCAGIGMLLRLAFAGQGQCGLGRAGFDRAVHLQHGRCGAQLADFPGNLGLCTGALFVATHGVADFGEVAGALGRNHRALVAAKAHRDRRQSMLCGCLQPQSLQARQHGLVQRGDAIVIKARGHGAKNGHGFGALVPGFAVALHLLGDVAQRVAGALAVKFVDGNKFGKVQHIDFFKLAGRAKLGRHDVQGHVHQRHDGRVALPDARSFHHDQVKAGHLAGGNRIGQRLADFRTKLACGQRAHKNTRCIVRGGPGRNRIHADAVAEQSAAAFAARGVNGDHGNAQAVAQIQPKAADQLVGERRFTGATGASDTDGGHFGIGGTAAQVLH